MSCTCQEYAVPLIPDISYICYNFTHMINMSLADKVITLRKKKGLSQEELAELSNINLRTIQRIESGVNTPRGYTLQAIARALEVSVEYLSDNEKTENRSFVGLVNMSALSFLIFPLLNVIVPLVLWHNRKEQISDVYEVGRRVINFQILWSVILYFLLLLWLILQLVMKYYFEKVYGLGFLTITITMYVINTICILYSAVQLRRGNNNVYPTKISVL